MTLSPLPVQLLLHQCERPQIFPFSGSKVQPCQSFAVWYSLPLGDSGEMFAGSATIVVASQSKKRLWCQQPVVCVLLPVEGLKLGLTPALTKLHLSAAASGIQLCNTTSMGMFFFSTKIQLVETLWTQNAHYRAKWYGWNRICYDSYCIYGMHYVKVHCWASYFFFKFRNKLEPGAAFP